MLWESASRGLLQKFPDMEHCPFLPSPPSKRERSDLWELRHLHDEEMSSEEWPWRCSEDEDEIDFEDRIDLEVLGEWPSRCSEEEWPGISILMEPSSEDDDEINWMSVSF